MAFEVVDETRGKFRLTSWRWRNRGRGEKQDFLCLSKGLTGGYLPLSVVLTTDPVYATFYDDAVIRGFLHSHSYTWTAYIKRRFFSRQTANKKENCQNGKIFHCKLPIS